MRRLELPSVCIVPDCGMGPGMGNTLAVYAMGLLDQASARDDL